MAAGVYRHASPTVKEGVEILSWRDGKTASIGLARDARGLVEITTNGKADASINMSGKGSPSPDEITMTLAAVIPMLHHRQARTAVSYTHLDVYKRQLVVHGAAGGVGLTAIAIGKQLGATVIATANGPEKLAVARAHGADHLIDASREDVRTRIRELTDGRGADVVYDPVGGELFTASLRSIAFAGRIVIIGFASGIVPQIPANHLLVKNVDVIGLNWPAYAELNPRVMTESFQTLMQWYLDGAIVPHVSATYPLAEAIEALNQVLLRKSTGKVVLLMDRRD